MASTTHSDDRGRSSTQFSLRTLLLIISITALLLAPFPWFGVSYLFAAGLSAAVVIACSLTYRLDRTMPVLVAISSVLFGFTIGLTAIVFLFHVLVNLLACIVLAIVHPHPKIYTVALSALMLAIYGSALIRGFAEFQHIHSLQAQYPFKSVAARLAFEQPSAHNASQASSIEELSSKVTAHLNSQDAEQTSRGWRSDALRELHSDYQRQFARAAGFGFTRMPSLRYRVVRSNREKPLSLPKPIDLAQSPSSSDELFNVHRLAAADFTTPDGIGYVKSRDAVAGFEPHQIKTSWQWDHNNPSTQSWQIVRLELVGILRSEESRVYTAKTLPPMDQIADTPYRELNQFELTALPKLVSQDDVVVDQTPDRIQMLGALRAGKTCLECHEGQRGKLLGAFSYELTPIATPPNKGETPASQPTGPNPSSETPNYM